MSHPRLTCYSTEELTYRATALCRIAKILDSVLYLLSGPSLLKDQSLYGCKYQLHSFTESSFTSSWLLPGSGNFSLLSNAMEKVHVDEAKKKNSGDSCRLNTQQQETECKETKVPQGMLDRYKEELKLIKKQV